MTIGERVLQIAVGELGTKECPANSNRQKYGEWYGWNGVSWCMQFVQWDYSTAGNPLPYKTASCSALLNWYRAHQPERIVTEPTVGDIIIYTFGHTGIFERDNGDGTITAIEGNTAYGNDSNGGEVMRRVRPKSTIKAYIHPFDGDIPDEEDEHMTGEEIYNALCEYTATQELPGWAFEEFASAVAAGITDGSNPCRLIPRYQAAIMAHRAALAAIESVKGAR